MTVICHSAGLLQRNYNERPEFWSENWRWMEVAGGGWRGLEVTGGGWREVNYLKVSGVSQPGGDTWSPS